MSGNVSLYNETGGRPIPPTPVVGCIGLVRDLAAVPGRWRRGDRAVFLPGSGAELVAFVWGHAHRFTLAHDVASPADVQEAGRWSQVEPGFVAPPEAGVIVALPPEDDGPVGFPGAFELGRV